MTQQKILPRGQAQALVRKKRQAAALKANMKRRKLAANETKSKKEMT